MAFRRSGVRFPSAPPVFTVGYTGVRYADWNCVSLMRITAVSVIAEILTGWLKVRHPSHPVSADTQTVHGQQLAHLQGAILDWLPSKVA